LTIVTGRDILDFFFKSTLSVMITEMPFFLT